LIAIVVNLNLQNKKIIISNLTVAIFLLLSSITAILTGNKFIAFSHHPKLNRNEI
jgi:hypothetical protein